MTRTADLEQLQELEQFLEDVITMLGPRKLGPARFTKQGKHAHVCGVCDHRFEHANSSVNDEEAHMCPRCGEGPWWTKDF